MGRQRAHENLMHREQDARHLYGFAAQHARMLKHNEDVKAGRPVTPEDRAHARDLAERIATDGAAAAEDIFGEPEAPVGPATSMDSADDLSTSDFLRAMAAPQDHTHNT
jgi:hypothetical protein